MRLRLLAAIALVSVLSLALGACAGGSKGGNTGVAGTATDPPDLNPTEAARQLHLSIGVFTVSQYRRSIEFLLKTPLQHRTNCPDFLTGSATDAQRAFEKKTRGVSSSLPNLTPVADDEAAAGKIIQEVCLEYPDVTPPPGVTSTLPTYTPVP